MKTGGRRISWNYDVLLSGWERRFLFFPLLGLSKNREKRGPLITTGSANPGAKDGKKEAHNAWGGNIRKKAFFSSRKAAVLREK